LGLSFPIGAVGCGPGGSTGAIGPAQAYELMQRNPDVFVLDVRYRYEFLEGYVPGSVLIPLHALAEHIVNNRLHPEINHGRSPRKDQPILVICRTTRRSARAARTLRQMGYTDVRYVTGGVMAWQRAGLPLARGLPQSRPSGRHGGRTGPAGAAGAAR